MKHIKLSLLIAVITASTFQLKAQWSLTGNSVTSGQFLGTTNNTDLIFKRNNTHIFSVTSNNSYTLGWVATTPPSGDYAFSIGDFRTSGGNNSSNNAFSIGNSAGNFFANNSFAIGNTSTNTNSLNSFVLGNNAVSVNANSSFAIGNDITLDDAAGYSPAIKSFGIGSDIMLIGTKQFAIGSGVNSTTQLTNGIDNSLVIGFNSTIPTLFVGPSTGAATTGKIGIATTTPSEKLDVNGAIHLGTTSTTNAGTLRYTGTDFEGYVGGQWKSFTAQAASQWSASGSNLAWSTGTVTIGTTPNTTAKFNVFGDAFIANKLYYRNQYSVASGAFVQMNVNASSNILASEFAYRVELVTIGTGASTGAVYVVRQSGASSWVAIPVNVTTAGNNPQLRVNGNKLEIFHNHASTYSVVAFVTTTITNNATVTSPGFFGLEGAISVVDGNTGIGTTAPQAKLHVAGGDIFLGNTSNGQRWIMNTRTANSSDMFIIAPDDASGAWDYTKQFAIHRSTGKVFIGDVAPAAITSGAYRLYVRGGILSDKVKVSVYNASAWADYVFAKDYKLASLKEVETFIEKNQHLPGVPSAEEVVANGIEMAEMNATLLKKIEELTLYMIEQNKRLEKLEKENAELKSND